jgi:AraC family transcriptional regulator
VAVNHCRLDPGDLPEHQYTSHKVIVILDGDTLCEMTTDGGRPKETYPTTGSICIVPSGHRQRVRVGGRLEYLSISIDSTIMARAAGGFRWMTSSGVPAYILDRDPVIWQVSMGFMKELEGSHENSALFAESLAKVLAVHLVRNYSGDEPVAHALRGGLTGRAVRQVERYVEEHLEQGPTVAEMAEIVELSPYHFAREFKRATGLSPHQFLTERRIDRAKSLLAETGLPIAEIGLIVGFSSQSHFTRLFRKLTSVTPNAFRRTGIEAS